MPGQTGLELVIPSFKSDQSGFNEINWTKLDQTGPNWIKLDKLVQTRSTGTYQFKSDQVGSKDTTLDQVGSNHMKPVQISSYLF